MQTLFACAGIWQNGPGRNHVVRTYTLAKASGCGPAIRQDISPAFYQSLNQNRRTLIGVARCVFGDPKTRPVTGRSGRGETPQDTPEGARNERAGDAWRDRKKHRRRNGKTGSIPG
jgi:hypothetical protein